MTQLKVLIAEMMHNPVVAVRKMQLRNVFPDDPDFVNQIETERAILLEHCDDVYTIIIPEHIRHEDPVVFVGGFSQGIHAYAGELHEFYKAGYVTVYLNPIFGYRGPLLKKHGQFQGAYTVPDVVLRKVFAIDAVLHQLDAEKYHLIGHSQGGMLAAHVAALHAENVHTLTLVNPEGFQKEQSAWEIASKFAYQAADQMRDTTSQVLRGETELLEPSSRAGRTFMRNFMMQPLWRLTDEVPEGIRADVAALLQYLKTMPTQVMLLNAHSDQLFTPGEFKEYLMRDYGTGGGDMFALIDGWTSFLRKDAGHTAPGIEKPGLLLQIISANHKE